MIKSNFSKANFKEVKLVMKAAFDNFKQNDPLRLAASTAFFATFAIPAILVVLIRIFGIFLNRRKFGGNIIDKLTQLIGENSASEIRHILRNMLRLSESWYSTIFIFLFLVFVSTTLFIIIRNSINQLWCIRVKTGLGAYFHAKQRAKSLAIISAGGFLMLVVFILEGVRLFIEKRFEGYHIPYLGGFLNELIFFVITSTWFCIAFRFVANGKPIWKAALFASMFSGLFFTIGKVIMRSILLNSNLNEIYGPSGAILLVMLFVFYSSFIFYFGACLVDAISENLKCPIQTSEQSYKYKFEEIDAES